MATWFQKFGSWLKEGFNKETRINNGLGRFLDGIDNFWNKITGSGLTGAEREANEFSARQAELAFEREAEFYEKNQSIKAQITQQQEAGINPFSINGSASSGPVVSSSAPSSVTPTGSQGFDPIALAMQIAQFRLQKQVTEAEIGKTKAETNQILKNTDWIDRLNIMSIDEARQRISESVSTIANADADTAIKSAELARIASSIANTDADTAVKHQQIALMLSEMAVNDKSLKVMDKQIAQMSADISLKGSQAGLNRSQAKLLSQEWRNLTQQFSHNEIMNAFEEITASRDSGEAGGYYRVTSEVKRFIDSFLGWFSGGASIFSKK